MNQGHKFNNQRNNNREYREDIPYKRQRFNSHSASPRPFNNDNRNKRNFESDSRQEKRPLERKQSLNH